MYSLHCLICRIYPRISVRRGKEGEKSYCTTGNFIFYGFINGFTSSVCSTISFSRAIIRLCASWSSRDLLFIFLRYNNSFIPHYSKSFWQRKNLAVLTLKVDLPLVAHPLSFQNPYFQWSFQLLIVFVSVLGVLVLMNLLLSDVFLPPLPFHRPYRRKTVLWKISRPKMRKRKAAMNMHAHRNITWHPN